MSEAKSFHKFRQYAQAILLACMLLPMEAWAAPELSSENWHFEMSKNIAIELADTPAWSMALPYLAELTPKTQDWNVMLLHAKVELQRGNIDEADRIIQKALSANPQNARVLAMAGNIAADAGRYNDAVRYLEKARSIHPNAAPIMLSLARIRFARKEWLEVITLYERALSLISPTSEIYVRLSTAYENMGTLERAEFYLKENLEVHPNRHLALMPLERFYRRHNRLEQAEQTARERAILQQKKEEDTRSLRALQKSAR
ncbi:MAG: tetratricopeptide repeat protein [Proteobacteria bacterium]|nr:tetratricopeptide repeat protein [Pseudomonadota bacterium]